jgi:ankyrin repeat protein
MNAQGDRGFTPLHSAVLDNQLDAVKFLLEMGVDRQLTNDDGNTALDLAKIMGHDDIVKLLE